MEATWLALVPTAMAIAVTTSSTLAFARVMKRRPAHTEPTRFPKVSILKPLAGEDDQLGSNLRSFAHIDYPAFEILLGVASFTDPAYPIAQRFASEHAHLPIRIVRTDPRAAINPKVAQLIGLEAAASGDVLVISDSNVQVAPSYLKTLVAALEGPGIGLVSSLITGTGAQNIGAALENLQLTTGIAPHVVTLSTCFGQPLTIGKSMAMRRKDLARAGGFLAVADVLAEDFMLGRLFQRAGMGVALSLFPVENRNVHCGVWRTLERHTRWAKMRRAIAPASFLSELLLLPGMLATLLWLAYPNQSTRWAMMAGLLTQVASAWLNARILKLPIPLTHLLPLECARILTLSVCWVRAALSRRIMWRGHPFMLGRDSRIWRVAPTGARLRAVRRVRAVLSS